MSLGTDSNAPACIEANNVKNEAVAKRNVKRPKRNMRERVYGKTHKWVVPCFDVNIVNESRPRYKK